VRRWSMWGTPERVPDAADIRRAIPLRRGLRGGDHDDAGLCSLVQGRTAALRLSKRVWLCRDAIHHAVTPRPCAPPHRRASSRWTRPGREGGPNCALRGVGRGGPTSAPRTARRVRSGRQPSGAGIRPTHACHFPHGGLQQSSWKARDPAEPHRRHLGLFRGGASRVMFTDV
jgi:hypothetical protein